MQRAVAPFASCRGWGDPVSANELLREEVRGLRATVRDLAAERRALLEENATLRARLGAEEG